MKKVLSFLLGCMIMASCSNEAEILNESFDAQNELQTMVEVSDNQNVTLTDIQAYMEKGSAIASRNGGDGEIEVITYQNDTVMYLLKYGNGWEMMPGDKRFPLRVAYNDEGTLDYANMHDAQRAWFESMAEEIHVMKKHGKGIENEYCKVWNAFSKKNKKKNNHAKSRTVIDGQGGWLYHNTRQESYVSGQKNHLITTLWHQNHPYNKYCPKDSADASKKSSVGCVAVAAGQVFHYMHKIIGVPAKMPESATEDTAAREYVFAGWSAEPWTEVKKGKEDYIALLLGHIGNICDMHYSYGASGADFYHDLYIKALPQYDINADYTGSWNPSYIVDDLDSNMPILADMHTSGVGSVGHTLIIDGYKEITTQYTDVYIYVEDMDSYPGDIYDHDEEMNPVPEEGPTQETSYFTTDTYYLVNWGSGYSDDTFYHSGINLSNGGYTYNTNKRILYNLRKR